MERGRAPSKRLREIGPARLTKADPVLLRVWQVAPEFFSSSSFASTCRCPQPVPQECPPRPKVQTLRGEKSGERVVTEDEFAIYLSSTSGLLKRVAVVLKESGMRPDECHRLRWEHLSWESGRNGTLLIAQGKSPAARRILPMTPQVRMIPESRWHKAGMPREGVRLACCNEERPHQSLDSKEAAHTGSETVGRSTVRPVTA